MFKQMLPQSLALLFFVSCAHSFTLNPALHFREYALRGKCSLPPAKLDIFSPGKFFPASTFRRYKLASLKAVVDFDDIDHVILRGSDGKSNMPENWSQSGVYACFNKNGEMQYVAMSRRVAASIDAHMQVVGPDCHSAKAVVWDKPAKSDLENTARAWIEKNVVKTGDAPPGNTPDVQIWRMKPSEARRAKQNIQFESGSSAGDAEKQIRKAVESNRVVLFMKGTRQAPQV
jgi:hypothetical protein